MGGYKDFITEVSDFPEEGVGFKDISPLLADEQTFRSAIVDMGGLVDDNLPDLWVGIDARGFIFGSAISLQSSKPMIVARKPGKLPGELVEKNYSLEYGENTLSIQKKALQKYSSYAIVDDLLATGGTVNCVSKILESNNKEVVGVLVVVELMKLEGKLKLNYPIESSITF